MNEPCGPAYCNAAVVSPICTVTFAMLLKCRNPVAYSVRTTWSPGFPRSIGCEISIGVCVPSGLTRTAAPVTDPVVAFARKSAGATAAIQTLADDVPAGEATVTLAIPVAVPGGI